MKKYVSNFMGMSEELTKRCWEGYKPVPGKKPYSEGSCAPVSKAEYKGKKVPLNKPMRGDVKKFKAFVDPDGDGKAKKVNFGDKNMEIKRDNPNRRKNFRARHNCENPGPKDKARYWSCRMWSSRKVSDLTKSGLIKSYLHKASQPDYKSMISQPHIMFSAENPIHFDESKHLKATHEDVLNHLRDMGEDAHETIGTYGQPERSIFVSNPKRPQEIEKLAQDLGQESVIISDGHNHHMVHLNGPDTGKIVAGSGTDFHAQEPNDFFTKMPDGTIFTHKIG